MDRLTAVKHFKAITLNTIGMAAFGGLWGCFRFTKFSSKQGVILAGLTTLALNIVLTVGRYIGSREDFPKTVASAFLVSIGGVGFSMYKHGLLAKKAHIVVMIFLFPFLYEITESIRLGNIHFEMEDVMKPI